MRHTTAPFADVLRRLRCATSLSQEELAERAGLSRRGISDLERGLRRAPRLETVRLLADALALGDADRAELLAAARPSLLRDPRNDATNRSRVSVPLPLTRLIGRETELRALHHSLCQGDIRLLTVTGAGGSGKTRLAMELAREAVDRYPDGVVFVDLSPLTDSGLVLPTIAAALGVREVAEQALIETLSAELRTKRLLLVLDNCERVLAVADDLVRLLAATPSLTILATSRVPFHVRGEREYPLLPLPLPGAGRPLALNDLAQIPSVALFVERAAATQPDFALSEDNAAIVTAICLRLDGLPLALELAAARVKILPPPALLARLERRLPLLTGGGRDLPARQRTMRDAIAWSYDLLTPEAQALFRRLAIFAGGFTLPAAEAVAGWEENRDVLDGISALVEQSLLRQAPQAPASNEPRYLMLETMREFGLEQLAESGEETETRARHADYFRQLSVSLGHGIRMQWSLDTLQLVAAERDNVRLALAWYDEREAFEALLQLSTMLLVAWTSPSRDGLSWVDRALERSRHVVSAARVEALNGAGILALFQGNHDRAAAYFAEELALARALGDAYGLGQALVNTGFLAYRCGEYGHAEARLVEALGPLREAASTNPDATLNLGRAHLLLGDTAMVQEQFDQAVGRYEEAFRLAPVSGTDWGQSDIRAGLAGARCCRGEFVQAATLYAESLARAHVSLNAESLARVEDRSFTPIILSALLGLAGLAAETGDPETGARLFGAAEGISASQHIPIFPRDLPVRERSLRGLRTMLRTNRLAAAMEAGRRLTIEAAVIEAKVLAESVAREASAVSN